MRTAPTARAPRAALAALQAGAVAVVLAALPFKAFELDRFFVPKELALHIAAALAGVLTLAAARDAGWRRWRPVDRALAGFLLLGILSAALADNRWLAVRALGISVSGAAVFWTAHALAGAGRGRPLVLALATAVTLGAATALLQAYGVDSDYFSINRSPGGTFGNRNFVAHVSAIGLPLVVLCALAARRSYGALASAIAIGVVSAALVLSRSRAAWLATLAALVPAAFAVWRARALPADPLVAARRRLVVLAGAVGILSALLLPNTLRWRSDSPYLDSVRNVVDYREGSGRGRLVQYENTLRMALAHPLLGVGPGNWPVWYPRFASRRDPSLGQDGLTSNPWPSSDWAAFLAERGLAACALLALVLAAAGAAAGRALAAARTVEETLAPPPWRRSSSPRSSSARSTRCSSSPPPRCSSGQPSASSGPPDRETGVALHAVRGRARPAVAASSSPPPSARSSSTAARRRRRRWRSPTKASAAPRSSAPRGPIRGATGCRSGSPAATRAGTAARACAITPAPRSPSTRTLRSRAASSRAAASPLRGGPRGSSEGRGVRGAERRRA